MVPYILIYLSITYLIAIEFQIKYKSIKLTLALIIISIFFPVGGMIVVAVILRNMSPIYKTSVMVDLDTDEREDSKSIFLSDINVKEESDIVPLDETLLLSDLQVRRKTLLNILKKGTDKYTNFINKAVKNEDSETTHYAATSIADTKRKLDIAMIEIAKQYKENPKDAVIAISYSELLEKQIDIVYIDNEMKRTIIKENISVLENIVNNKLSTNQDYIVRLIKLLVDEEEFNLAIKHLNTFMNNYIDTEEKYMTLLRSYYVMRDRENFEKVLSKIKEENILLSKESHNRIQFW